MSSAGAEAAPSSGKMIGIQVGAVTFVDEGEESILSKTQMES